MSPDVNDPSNPTPVKIVAVGDDVVASMSAAAPTPIPTTHLPLPPTTTLQQDLVAAGQRNINVKWESTQQIIAIAITFVVLLMTTYIVVWGESDLRQAAFIFMTNIAFLVIGTYFQRTNHTKRGGVDLDHFGR